MLPDPKSTNDRKNWARSLGLLSVITADLLGCTGAGVGIGYWLWKKRGMPWWVLLLFTMLGLVVAFYRLYLISQRNEEGMND